MLRRASRSRTAGRQIVDERRKFGGGKILIGHPLLLYLANSAVAAGSPAWISAPDDEIQSSEPVTIVAARHAREVGPDEHSLPNV
mgnify:CR=1 FL=1